MSEGPHLKGKYGGVLYQQGVKGIWQISYQGTDGKEIRESTHTTDQSIATQMLESRRRKVISAQDAGVPFELPKQRRITLAKALDGLEVQYRLKQRWNDTLVTDVKKLKERFGAMTADTISKGEIQKWQLEMKAGKSEKKSISTNATLNRRLTILTKALKIAGVTPLYQRDMADLRLPEPPPRQGHFEPHQFRILLAALPPHVADAILACYLTGWRWSEIAGRKVLGVYRAGVRWSEKDGNSLLIPAERNKGRKTRKIPLTGELAELVARRERARVEGSDLIFHDGTGRPIGEFRVPWKKACELAGRPGGLRHDLRRSRARAWRRAGVSEKVAMELGGWRTREIFDRYDIVSEGDMVAAQEKTEEFLKRQTEKQAEAKQISTAIN